MGPQGSGPYLCILVWFSLIWRLLHVFLVHARVLRAAWYLQGWEDFVLGLDEFAQQHKGTPLFNQTKGASASRVAASFDTRLPFFRKVRVKFDPHDRMLNQYFAGLIS